LEFLQVKVGQAKRLLIFLKNIDCPADKPNHVLSLLTLVLYTQDIWALSEMFERGIHEKKSMMTLKHDIL
jgi:hypothetical protein